jgi:hypothetical protein
MVKTKPRQRSNAAWVSDLRTSRKSSMANSNLCCIEECGNPACKRGYCNTHYIRLRRHGNPLATKRRVDPNNCQKKECPAAKKIFAHIHYIQNSETYKKNAEDWRKNNPEIYAERNKNYFSREDVKQKMRETTKQWVAANPERKRQMDLEFKENNKALVTSYKAKRRATLRQAMPSWLTQDQILQIRAIYAEAKRLSDETGIPHDVDHIVPLAGKIVSGLHVPWNLRAIPKIENNRRPRIYQID